MQTGTHPAACAAPRSPAQFLSVTGGQECGLPARKRPRWPLSQEAGGRAARGGGRRTGPGRLTPQYASHVQGGELFLSPPWRGGRRPGWVVPFARCRRAAATALTAAVMTLMSVAGIALTSDHTHLVYQRDILKAGTDAATLATPATCGHSVKICQTRM